MSARDDTFEWDEHKNQENIKKHKVSFFDAQMAFLDPKRVVAVDETHSTKSEMRFYCIGKISGGIVTTRFTYRDNRIRIFGEQSDPILPPFRFIPATNPI